MLFSCFRKKVVAFDVRLNHHVNNLATNGRVEQRQETDMFTNNWR